MKDHADHPTTRRTRPDQEGSAPGVISIHEIYTLTEARHRLRWTESSLRAARRRGLQLLCCGKRRYIAGREILRFLEAQSGVA
jgi:hypothetical protein